MASRKPTAAEVARILGNTPEGRFVLAAQKRVRDEAARLGITEHEVRMAAARRAVERSR